MSHKLRNITALLLPLFTLVLGWHLGGQFERKILSAQEQEFRAFAESGTGTLVEDPKEEVDIEILWDVWNLLVQNYITPEELGSQKMLYGAIKGLTESIGDPYTVYMTPKENTEFHESLNGDLEGIGAELRYRNNRVEIVSPLKGSPAEKAGLLPEDWIVEVDGESIENFSLHETVERIRGPKGTSVQITVIRKQVNEPVTVEIVRQKVHVPSVDMRTVQEGGELFGIVEVNQFGTDTIREMFTMLSGLKEQNIKGLVIDLRFNGGGYLDGAIEMASFFLTKGKVVTVERRTGAPQTHYVTGVPILPEIPLVVLINQGSASASEIVAGALQDYSRATVVGVKSFGKGTVQEVIDLRRGGSLRVTVAKWLTPGGKDLAKEGIEPDIEVERTQEDLDADRDPQLEKALQILQEKIQG